MLPNGFSLKPLVISQPDAARIGEKILRGIRWADLTTKQVGTLTKLGEKRIIEICKAQGKRPTLKELKLICDILDIELNEMISLQNASATIQTPRKLA